MILTQVSTLDCLVFLVFLAPQLLLQAGLLPAITCALRALPFLLIQLPYQLFTTRYLTPLSSRPPFVRTATLFQDLVIRCVRYAFASIPASIGRVFFSRAVALPFLRFRLLRHGYIQSPIPWEEISLDHNLRGLLIRTDPSTPPDVVLYYLHGGGFAMGSPHFYLEPLLVLASLLARSATNGKPRFRNPAIFALQYTLVPDAIYPTQLRETIEGYRYVLSLAGEHASRIAVAGDSAGGTLVLSLLLYIARPLARAEVQNRTIDAGQSAEGLPLPGMAALISPWTNIVSERNRDTPSDYLSAENLHRYAHRYAGTSGMIHDELVSPGRCKDLEWWRKASPEKGWVVLYGSEEVFAENTAEWVNVLRKAGVEGVREVIEEGGIHAWVIARAFLGETTEERGQGIEEIAGEVWKRLGAGIGAGEGEVKSSSDRLMSG